MNICSLVTLLLLILIIPHAKGQEVELTLMTPDSGVIRVNWENQFEWNDKGDLILKLTPPENIEIQGLLPHYGATGRQYQILIKDLFMKEKILIKGEGGKILSTQTLMININDHQKGVIKADPACPTNVHVPLFNRAILFIKCREMANYFVITEHGHINGQAYDNEYRFKTSSETLASSKDLSKLPRVPKVDLWDEGEAFPLRWRERAVYVQLEYQVIDHNEVSAGDGQIVLAGLSSDFAWEDLWLTPAMKLTLFSLLSNTSDRPLKGRHDEVSLRVRHDSWNDMILTPSVVTKIAGRGERNHYLATLAVGGGLAYQLQTIPVVQTYLDFFPGAGGREYRAFELGLKYQGQQIEYGLALAGERYRGEGDQKKTKSFGVMLNVAKGF